MTTTTGVRPTTAWYLADDATSNVANNLTVVRCGRTLVMLADAPVGAARAVWDGIGASASVTAVVDALAGLPGVGLTTLPSFAAVTLDDDGRAHVLARGDVRVALDGAAGRVEVDGSDVMTWHERRVDAVASVLLGQGWRKVADVFADPAAMPLVEGVVRAGLVALDLTGDARSGDASAGLRPIPLDEPPLDGARSVAGVLEAVPAEAVPARSESHETVHEETVHEETVHEETVLPATVPPETLLPTLAWSDEPSGQGADPESAADAEAADADSPEARATDVDAPEVVRLPVEATQAGPLDDADDAYAHLWGATVMRTVEDAAVRADEDEEDAEVSATPVPMPATPAPAAPVPAAPALLGLAASEPVAPSVGESGLIAGIPRAWGGGGANGGTAPQDPTPPHPIASHAIPQPAGEPQLVDLDEVDHDGHTVMSSALAHLRSAAAPEPLPEPVSAAVFGAQVLGRTCAQGHVNPPSRDDCRTCGTPLDGEAGPAPRPSLGRVRVAGGPVVELDRPLVVGRRPRTPRSTAGEMPRLVAVASPNQDVSRSHVEVRLEGWHVLVTDLATTNGTVLHREGQAPQRLHPSEATLVVDGDVVDLGDGVTLTFEEIW